MVLIYTHGVLYYHRKTMTLTFISIPKSQMAQQWLMFCELLKCMFPRCHESTDCSVRCGFVKSINSYWECRGLAPETAWLKRIARTQEKVPGEVMQHIKNGNGSTEDALHCTNTCSVKSFVDYIWSNMLHEEYFYTCLHNDPLHLSTLCSDILLPSSPLQTSSHKSTHSVSALAQKAFQSFLTDLIFVSSSPKLF